MTGPTKSQPSAATMAIPGAPGLPGERRPSGNISRSSVSAARPGQRHGYTLLEMLIVLAILAVLASASYPALRGSLEKRRLHEGAKQVRIELARARVAAIESGSPRQFRFQEGGSGFELSRCMPADDSTQWVWDEEQSAAMIEEFTLPEGITFAPLESPEEAPAAPIQDGAPVAEQWSPPVLFFPNGRSTNVRIRLQASRGWFVDLTLRGITGTAKVGKVGRQEVTP